MGKKPKFTADEVIPIHDLPVLPEGWDYEQGAFGADIIHVVWPEHGAMSLDFKNRSMSFGFPSREPQGKKSFLGKGWKTAFVTEAVNRLRAAWT